MNSSGVRIGSGQPRPEVAIIGGSGMCTFPELRELYRVRPTTRYGLPSDDIRVCEHQGATVAFLPRHGAEHAIAPHSVPYKANLTALRELGVRTILATCIVGSLKKEIAPGSLVVPDQFVNMTWGRDDYTEQDGGGFLHLPMADPYCAVTRQAIVRSVIDAGYPVVDRGTVAVIQGPRFSTRAESEFYIRNGWDIVNMTQYPECYLARELGMCYGVIAVVTDYDVGVPSQFAMDPKHMERVLAVFRENISKTKRVALSFLESYGTTTCECARVATGTYYEQK